MFNTRSNLFSIAIMILALGSGCDSSPTANSPQNTGLDIGTVGLTIDFGPARRKPIEVDVPCSVDSTVIDILSRAQNMGDLKFESTGSGDTVFVKSIASMGNEGAGGSNWIFLVNEETGDKSAGVIAVEPSDKIRWRFGTPPDELQEMP